MSAQTQQLSPALTSGTKYVRRGSKKRSELQLIQNDLVLSPRGSTARSSSKRAEQEAGEADAAGRLENLKELISAMEEFESLAGFMEHVSLVMENAERSQEEMVSLMTLHSAKGLEFDVVFLPGWEEGLFPHQRALDESGMDGLEEERRLAYVGITRARRRIDISHASNRRIHNLWQNSAPSRFINELPKDQIDMISEVGEYGGYGNFGGLSDDKGSWATSTVGGPGWQRFQSRRNQPTTIEGTARPPREDAAVARHSIYKVEEPAHRQSLSRQQSSHHGARRSRSPPVSPRYLG